MMSRRRPGRRALAAKEAKAMNKRRLDRGRRLDLMSAQMSSSLLMLKC